MESMTPDFQRAGSSNMLGACVIDFHLAKWSEMYPDKIELVSLKSECRKNIKHDILMTYCIYDLRSVLGLNAEDVSLLYNQLAIG